MTFRRTFHYKRFESAKCLQDAFGAMDIIHMYDYIKVAQWIRGRALDLRSLDRRFDSHLGQCAATLGKLFTPMCLYHQAV